MWSFLLRRFGRLSERPSSRRTLRTGLSHSLARASFNALTLGVNVCPETLLWHYIRRRPAGLGFGLPFAFLGLGLVIDLADLYPGIYNSVAGGAWYPETMPNRSVAALLSLVLILPSAWPV